MEKEEPRFSMVGGRSDVVGGDVCQRAANFRNVAKCVLVNEFTTDDGTSQSVDAAPPNYNLSYQNTGWSLYIKLSWGRLTTHTRLGLLLRDRGWERSF